MADLLIDVPFYSQFKDSGLDPYWQKRSCGVLALKMILDYWRLKNGQGPIETSELFDRAMKYGGMVPELNNDLSHPAMVKTARSYGFRSWRRIWYLSKEQQAALKREGADSATLKRNQLQQQREALPTLVETIENGYPVIISAAKNFDDVKKNHFVVLTGIRRREETASYQGVFFNDPYSPTRNDRKDRYVAIARFNDKWNYRAIFVEPK